VPLISLLPTTTCQSKLAASCLIMMSNVRCLCAGRRRSCQSVTRSNQGRSLSRFRRWRERALLSVTGHATGKIERGDKPYIGARAPRFETIRDRAKTISKTRCAAHGRSCRLGISGAARSDHYRIMTWALQKHNSPRSPKVASAMPDLPSTRQMDDRSKARAISA
jgi:hypothetical protein